MRFVLSLCDNIPLLYAVPSGPIATTTSLSLMLFALARLIIGSWTMAHGPQ
ncbi:hypothetical protein JCM19239_6389 [Vibrio variabilis]|uniref:Uncharacterized protein n=1 Tax=Vibrio variabilis TaxID=990271 RepID=A0ABQ0JMC6_9VIBR|nr:hypothetical protein JCM19239_6389 [Vibrio variabilis]